jgi:translation initiation factor eIF-2B subunit alpha/methylthioribose-1-phosphate isomerase
MKTIDSGCSISEKKKLAIEEANKIAEQDVDVCKKIGEYGNKLIKNGNKILTHCNAGALATVDYGTALAPIRFAHYEKKKIFVFVDETRPRCQGSKLTAWELLQEDIPHSIIADNAAGYYMQKGEVDLCIVGADRVTADGSIANKIGTYEKAVLAKENNIPFYVAVPSNTFDKNIKSGKDIPIEERSEEEVTHISGFIDDDIKNVRIAPEGSHAKNPAFDVTSAKYITDFITEKGIINPRDIKKLLN